MVKHLMAAATLSCLIASAALAAASDYKIEGTATPKGTSTELTLRVMNIKTGKHVTDAKVWHFSSHQMQKGPSPMELKHSAAPDGKDAYKVELPLHGHGQQFEHFMVSVPGEREPIHARIQLPLSK
jgi:hypothetical protein